MDKSQANVSIDLKGLNCPMPVLKTKKALDSMQPGQVLFVEATDKGSKADISLQSSCPLTSMIIGSAVTPVGKPAVVKFSSTGALLLSAAQQ